jgi:hypothetical protein
VVTKKQGQQLGTEHGIAYAEISAMNFHDVDNLFLDIATKQYLDNSRTITLKQT